MVAIHQAGSPETHLGQRKRTLDIIIPAYNEATGINATLDTLLDCVAQFEDLEVGVLVVDDGSQDNTGDMVASRAGQAPCIRLLTLTRNFGKEAAICAGLQHTRADAAVVMDSDLQHPPELLQQMVALWRQGYEVVEAVKVDRRSDALSNRVFAASFYRLFSTLSGLDITNHSDFKLLDRYAIEGYLALPERVRFFRGLVRWMGYRSAQVPVTIPLRNEGRSRWSASRLLSYSVQALTAFSSAPLYIVTVLGGVTLIVSLIFGVVAVADKLSGVAVDGFTTVIILLLFFSSILMVSLGMIGVYLSRIYDEVKGRPIYLVDWQRSTALTDTGELGKQRPLAQSDPG